MWLSRASNRELMTGQETSLCEFEFEQICKEKWSKMGVQMWTPYFTQDVVVPSCPTVRSWVEIRSVARHHLRLTGLRGSRVRQKSMQGTSGHAAVLQPSLA